MPAINLEYKTYFDEFEVNVLLSEPILKNGLFGTEIKEVQIKQLEIFKRLEAGLPMFNGSSFGSQVNFQKAYQIPVQRWFPYREGYSTLLVNAFIRELGITGNVFDPFCGSGTTLLAARINDLNSFGIDVNPISVLVARVENEQYGEIEFNGFIHEINRIHALSKSEEAFCTPFELAGKVFNQEILNTLLQFKSHINRITNEKIRNLIFVAWLSIIEDVSNIKKEGNGIKYKNRKRTPDGYMNINKDVWEKQTFPEDKFSFVKHKLLKQLEIFLADMNSNYGQCEKKPYIFNGSCLEFSIFFSDELQLTFFSPPYCNCFDYFEIHKVELWLGDFINSKEEFRLLRNTGFRSNTNSLNHKSIINNNEYLENLISLFDSEKLWNNRIPDIVRGYFDDMHRLLAKLYQQTINGGYVGIVVGNSAYSGVIIPTDILITHIARKIGFKVKNIFVTRHLTTSSQQKQDLEYLKNYLRESIVLLKK